MTDSNKECEYDPDHLYHDHREADELRAENAELKRALALVSKAGRADNEENERLRAEIVTWGEIWNNAELLAARVEALRDGTAQT